MRILVESPNCNATAGSNAGVGWGWVTNLARRHEVHVVAYEPLYAGSPPVEGVRVIPIAATSTRRLGSMTDFVRSARRRRDEIIASVEPDVVHSVEPGGWLGPRALATARVPYVLGPLNGGASLAPRGFAEAVLEALPVTPAKAFFSGGPRRLAVTLVNEALFGNIPTSRALARRAFARARRILLATSLTPGAIRPEHEPKTRRVPLTGFDLSLFHPRERPGGPLTVLYAGRIVPAKGLHLVVEALAGCGVRLRIAGGVTPEDAWYEHHCRARADVLGVADRVTWLGSMPREQLAAEYARADLYAMLSLWEPFGMTYVEAMASGTPVVGLAAGGVTEIVPPDAGWLVRPTTPEGVVADLSALLVRLEADRGEARAAGVRARAHAEATYTWPRILDQIDAIYAEIA